MLFRNRLRLRAPVARERQRHLARTIRAVRSCETLKSRQGLPLNGPWVFNNTLSPAEALEPELLGDSKVSLKLP